MSSAEAILNERRPGMKKSRSNCTMSLAGRWTFAMAPQMHTLGALFPATSRTATNLALWTGDGADTHTPPRLSQVSLSFFPLSDIY